jgi:hypothetical protein
MKLRLKNGKDLDVDFWSFFKFYVLSYFVSFLIIFIIGLMLEVLG